MISISSTYFINAFTLWAFSACPMNAFHVGVSSAKPAEDSPPTSGLPSSQPPYICLFMVLLHFMIYSMYNLLS